MDKQKGKDLSGILMFMIVEDVSAPPTLLPTTVPVDCGGVADQTWCFVFDLSAPAVTPVIPNAQRSCADLYRSDGMLTTAATIGNPVCPSSSSLPSPLLLLPLLSGDAAN